MAMHRNTFRILLLLAALIIGGCGLVNSVENGGAVLLRVTNASDNDFQSVFVSFPQGDAEFGAVAAGEVTAYRELPGAYHYGYVEVVAEGDTLRMMPIDYVGEKPLQGGRYTFVLDVDGQNLDLEFVRN